MIHDILNYKIQLFFLEKDHIELKPKDIEVHVFTKEHSYIAWFVPKRVRLNPNKKNSLRVCEKMGFKH